MDTLRKPFQGVGNIIRFNWHFYVLAAVAVIGLMVLAQFLEGVWPVMIYLVCAGVVGTTLITLSVSWYVYDQSGLYNFDWIKTESKPAVIVNINAGFDETSTLLQAKFPDASLIALDFYDPEKHTEVSIKRARKAYPPFPGTQTVRTEALPLEDHAVDAVFVIFAAHEIREETERIAFFRELARILKPGGKLTITEHLQDTANFLAYNIGFFHFHPKSSWLTTFRESGFEVQEETKLTPFISNFILVKHGSTP